MKCVYTSRSINLIVLIFLALSFIATEAFARAQRMAIPKGNISLSANSSGHMRAFCLDADRPAPRIQNLSNVLTGATSAFVQVGAQGAPIALQDAINRGLVAVKGANSFSRLEFENLSGKDIRISFNETTVVSEAKESIDDIHLSDVLSGNQFKIWTSSDQRRLKELGYYQGEIDGNENDAYWSAFRDFNSDTNVHPFDSSKMLVKASKMRNEVLALNTSPPPKTAFRIDKVSSPPPAMLLVGPNGKPKGIKRVEDVSEFVDFAIERATPDKLIHFEIGNFKKSGDVTALANTLRIQLAAKSPEMRSRLAGAIDEKILNQINGGKLARNFNNVDTFPTGPKYDKERKRWIMEIPLIAKEPFLMRVLGKTEAAVLKLYQNVGRLFGKEPSLLNQDFDDMAAQLREMLNKRQIDGEVEITNELMRTIIVDARALNNSPNLLIASTSFLY